jgi:D-beta-D-heptose 7-phosphate kinase/D-beta-D-heptose 1-phosphate adenosyltransferase
MIKVMKELGLTQAQVEAYVDRFESSRVCVLGDVMLDRYFWGVVDRISPEAPVPVVTVNRRSSRLGGAANVAANLRALGIQVALVGLIGDDRAGDEFRGLIERQGISADHLHVEKGQETTEKVRIIAQSQQVVRADFEAKPEIPEERMGQTLLALTGDPDDYDALIVSDYGKGVIRQGFLASLIAEWRGKNKPVLVDPYTAHYRWYSGASVVTPNTKEASSFFGSTLDREELFCTLGFRMREELGLSALLITRGEDGMSLFLEDGKQIDIPTVATEVYDVTGAGDTVISVLGAAMASGAPLIDGVVMANQAAGEVIKEVGTSTITKDRLVSAFE